jgi:hypothetical protein
MTKQEDLDELEFNDIQAGLFPQFPIEGRRAALNSDEFIFRKAKIYKLNGNNNTKDDRIKVQVLPELAGIKEEEKEFLPEYPPFFAGTFHPGDEGEYTWVICTPDLQQGYVIGPSNIFPIDDKYVKGSSYNYTAIKNFLKQRQACPTDFEYEDIVIDKCVMTDKGGVCEGYNRKTGDWFLLNSTGAVITVQQQKIYLRVGSPPNPISSGPTGFSAITMTPNFVKFKTPNFQVEADTVTLGHHGRALFAGGGMDFGTQGQPFIPADGVYI